MVAGPSRVAGCYILLWCGIVPCLFAPEPALVTRIPCLPLFSVPCTLCHLVCVLPAYPLRFVAHGGRGCCYGPVSAGMALDYTNRGVCPSHSPNRH
jgi:hypothetical protein